MQESVFNKVAGLRPATLLRKRLWHICFPANFAKFLRTPLVAASVFKSFRKASFSKQPFANDL